MKIKLLKGAHLSERKCREILELFCDDLTATQIAEISGVSRVTVNNYFKLIRNRIAGYCVKKYSISHLQTHTHISNEADYRYEEQAYYGFVMKQGAVYTHWLKNMDDKIFGQFVNKTVQIPSAKCVPSVFEGFHAIADCDAWNLYWLNPVENLIETDDLTAEIKSFWQHTRGRLQKFRGMNKKMLFLHIKECEFRYNYRNDELFPLLMNILNSSGTAQSVSSEFSHIK
ncbi:MAG: hypothetical protein JST63_10405 [Bacteroidetes bacterium]|nr:hypothetical protein [Bacteroidota bacterium]